MIRFSKSYIPTLKEAPADAEALSHQLLIRAGMIRKLTAGVYIYMPLLLRSLEKISNIIRQEMNASGAQEILMPMVQPADLWKESGRWEFYGKELLRFRDRHGRDCCLGPTHEEVVTNLLRGEVKSYRQLPINLYQIQTKFRDEIRPRFGLMRGREFIMKDGYSFDRDEESAAASYQSMFEAYRRVFSRLGLRFRAVEADSGAIGGSFSHEFMVMSETGEDTIVVCSSCEYAANLERAEALCPPADLSSRIAPPMKEVATPYLHTVEEVAEFLSVEPSRLIKTLIFEADGALMAALVRGDRNINEIKLKNILDVSNIVLASSEQILMATGGPVGFSGPVGLNMTIIADQELQVATNYVVGANKKDVHLMHVDLPRDVGALRYEDLRQLSCADPCPRCGGQLQMPRGIEVGHVFKLGAKYSQAMKAFFLDEDGCEKPMIMGCYGIGVSRVAAACIEQNHDEKGIIFPPPMAPLDVEIINLGPDDAVVSAKAGELAAHIERLGLETLLDDRDERPGVKFKDADLIGLPMQVIIGARGMERGAAEAKDRRTGERYELPLEGFSGHFKSWREKVLEGWKEVSSWE